jgi:CRISPR-associated endonuclease Cas1
MPNQPNSSVSPEASNQIHRIAPKGGVVTLFGYGIQVRVDRGHLILEDGIGPDRRHARFPKVGSGLERIVTIGNEGSVSLAALRWLADRKTAFVMLDRNGSVLSATGPVSRSDARLRRAQARADETNLGLQIVRELIELKLSGQQVVARDTLMNAGAADAIALIRAQLSATKTMDAIRVCEARAAVAYWQGWRAVNLTFPKRDLPRTPEHWLSFGSRTSPLSGFSPRLAINPINAILNYIYAILESESRLAIAAMGLDPGMGFLHVDNDRRDSLACDLMEAVRPEVDAFVLNWVAHRPFSRDWFFEERNGNCRLMGEFAATLSETAPRWRQAVAPLAEWLARVFWEQSPKMSGHRAPANRLTQSRKRSVQGGMPSLPALRASSAQNLCRIGCVAPKGRRFNT